MTKFKASSLLVLIIASSLSAKVKRHVSVLTGTPESMVRQNIEIDRLKLPRIVNNKQLNQLISQDELVRLPENETLKITANVQENRKYSRPWTRDFVVDMGASFFKCFHLPLVIDSAVRTVDQQHALRKINKYAAPETGEYPSSHLAGITVDLAKRRYTSVQRRWIVSYLLDLKAKGLVEPTEEPYCFHVAVYEKYLEKKLYERNTTNSLIPPYTGRDGRLYQTLYRSLL